MKPAMMIPAAKKIDRLTSTRLKIAASCLARSWSALLAARQQNHRPRAGWRAGGNAFDHDHGSINNQAEIRSRRPIAGSRIRRASQMPTRKNSANGIVVPTIDGTAQVARKYHCSRKISPIPNTCVEARAGRDVE